MANTNSSTTLTKDKLKLFRFEFSFSIQDKITYLLLLILVYIIYSIRSNFYGIPFERDEGIYCYMGKLLLEGKTPYIDFYEIKFPGLFYLYAFVVNFFGDTVQGMHKGFMWINIFTMIFVFFAVKNLFNNTAAIIAAATFSVVSITPALSGFTVQSEHGVSFFIALGVLFYSLLKLYNKLMFFFLFGFSLCMAVMIKQTAIFIALWGGLILLTDFVFTKEKNYKKTIKEMLIFITGAAFVVILMFGLVYLKGGFKDMIYFTFEHTKQYSQSMPIEEGIKYFKYTRDAIIKDYMFFWVHAILSILVLVLPSTNLKQKIFTLTIAVASFLTIVPGYFFYGHYWIQTVPGIAILAGVTVYSITIFIETKLKKRSNTVNYIYLSVFTIFFVKHLNDNKSFYYHPNYTYILRTTYGNNPFPEAWEIGKFINDNAKPEDGLLLIGSEPQIYFYTKKKAPSKHAYFTAVVNNVPMHKVWQREFAIGAEKEKPKYVVFFNHQLSLLVQANTDNFVFEWANKFIQKNYKVVGVVEMADGQPSNYIWKDAAMNYQPRTPSYVLVFERIAK